MSNTRAKAALDGSRFADLRWVPDTGSTNTDVQQALVSAVQANPGSHADLVIIADHQRSGRGRLDRTWDAPPGASLLMSIGTTATVADTHRGLILNAMSLAGVAAIHSVCGVKVGVKWPNDLVWSGDVAIDNAPASTGETVSNLLKVAGVLAETVALPGRRTGYVVGVGINCNWGEMPESLSGIATSLDILRGAHVDRGELAVRIVEGFARRLELLEGAMADDLLVEARANSATLGTYVVAQTPDGELRGRAVDLDHDGALLVVAGGTGPNEPPVRVTVGDVVHLRRS